MVSLAWCGTAVGQQDGYVGVPLRVGGFESSDPVLTDEVMTGLIPTGQDRFLFGTSDRGGISGWIDGGPWAAYQQQLAVWNRNFMAAMEAKGYTVR